MSEGGSKNTRIHFLPLLALLFIGLKLCGVIGWSWWWVLAPLWGPYAIGVAIWVAAVTFGITIMLVSRMKDGGE